MPKFYLDVVVDDRLIPDDIGMELVSREAAIAEALAMADDLASTPGDEDGGPSLVFVLCNEHHEQIASFPVRRPDVRINGCRVVLAQAERS